MIIDSMLGEVRVIPNDAWKSIKIRKLSEKEHVLTSRGAGPRLSGYIRASEASSFCFRCLCVLCKP